MMTLAASHRQYVLAMGRRTQRPKENRAKTINDTDFAALRAVFKWGKQRGWLSTNPAAEAKIEGRGKKTNPREMVPGS